MYRIGIDAGAFSVQVSVLSPKDEIVFQKECPHRKEVKQTVVTLLRETAAQLSLTEAETLQVCATGSMSHLLNLPQSAVISDQAAVTCALDRFEPQAASVILLGAQKTMYASKPDGVHFEVRKNANCSAGTGAFFEEQASRLQLRLEDISAVVA